MKFGCRCGNVIVDGSDLLPYKASVTPDKIDVSTIEAQALDISRLIEACLQGQRSAFLEEHFGPGYPKDLDNETVIFDLILSARQTLDLYQCDVCGRLHLDDRRNPNAILSFAPEHEMRDVLDVTDAPE
jgi:hypothetical protein